MLFKNDIIWLHRIVLHPSSLLPRRPAPSLLPQRPLHRATPPVTATFVRATSATRLLRAKA
jgi:hypothetical protein